MNEAAQLLNRIANRNNALRHRSDPVLAGAGIENQLTDAARSLLQAIEKLEAFEQRDAVAHQKEMIARSAELADAIRADMKIIELAQRRRVSR